MAIRLQCLTTSTLQHALQEAHPVDIEVIVEQATPTPTETATSMPTRTPTATPTSDRVFLPLVVR
jgi:hypothetical protein